MSQRRTIPTIPLGHSPEGGDLDLDGLFLPWECSSFCGAQRRRLLACISGTITMCLVGTVYAWTNSSFLPLTTGMGDVPLRLTHDEYSWSVSLTVLSSMIGSLLAAQLADRIGRKYCLIACSTVFTLGWLHMYFASSVQMLYFARAILGIGVGIARTINPMFLSEVADIKLRGRLGTLIATNVHFGSLLTYALGPSLTYTSHLLAIVGISAISILPLIYIRETPYFLVAKGQKEQACKSIAYYKGIEDPDQVRVELRALRAEARYGLHQQSRRDLPPPFSINLPSSSSGDLPPSYNTLFPPPSCRDLPPPYTSNLPSQSIRETHSDPTREVVGTEATSDLNLPSSSDSHSQPISSVHSKFKCEIRTQATGELRVEYSRVSHGLPPQTTRELHSQSASDLHRPSTSQIHRRPTSKIHPDPTCEIHQASTSEKHPEATCEIHPESTSEILPETTNDIHRPSARQINRPSTSEIPREITREIHPEATSETHPETTNEIHRPSTSQIHRPSTSQILPETRSELHSRARSDLGTQSRVDSRASADISEPYMDLTKYTCLEKLRAILQRSNRKALFIMLGLIMTQHLSGNFTATQHLRDFISRKATSTGLNDILICVEIIRLLPSYLTVFIVDWCGRRKHVILSTAGTCCISILLSSYLYAPKYISEEFVTSLILHLVVFHIGLGTLLNVFLCDLFPTKLIGFVGAIVAIFDGVIGFTVSKLTQVITDNIGVFDNYALFASSCFVALVMMFICVPDTRGKTYREIEALLAGENLNPLNDEVNNDEMDVRRI